MDRIAISSSGLCAEISPLGAELQRLADMEGHDLLWNGEPAIWAGRSPVLFPIVGTLRNNSYRLDGRQFSLPRHGFARRRAFHIIRQSDDSVTLRLEDDAESRAVYPFAFMLDISFALSGKGLEMAAVIANPGAEPMPASIGFHPAFRWPLPFGARRGEHRITFAQPECAAVRRLDEDGLLSPQPRPSPIDGRELALCDALFDDDALIIDQPASSSLVYGAPGRPSLRIGFEGLPFLGLWNKRGGSFICIEPWQGIADPAGFDGDLREKPGIVLISPGEQRRFAMTVELVAWPGG